MTPAQRLASVPVARLATADATGVPHLVPFVFAVSGDDTLTGESYILDWNIKRRRDVAGEGIEILDKRPKRRPAWVHDYAPNIRCMVLAAPASITTPL